MYDTVMWDSGNIMYDTVMWDSGKVMYDTLCREVVKLCTIQLCRKIVTLCTIQLCGTVVKLCTIQLCGRVVKQKQCRLFKQVVTAFFEIEICIHYSAIAKLHYDKKSIILTTHKLNKLTITYEISILQILMHHYYQRHHCSES